DEPIRSDIVRFVSVCAERPRRLPSAPLSLPAHGKWVLRILAIEDRFLFGLYRRQMKAISYLGAIDRLFGVRATTRNWSTITAITKVLSLTSRPNAQDSIQRSTPRRSSISQSQSRGASMVEPAFVKSTTGRSCTSLTS